MITGADIERLRESFGLTQKQVSRALFMEESTLANYECNRRDFNMETLESIVNIFGYTVELNLVEKKNDIKNKDFYKEKKYDELINMPNEDLVDYLFITQENEVLSKICNIDVKILNSLELSSVKDLLAKSINYINKSSIYYILQNLHKDVELDISILVEDILTYLENDTTIPDDILEKTYYIDFDLQGNIDNSALESKKMRLLDINKNDLNVSHGLIMQDGLIPLFCYPQTYDLLYYIMYNPILQLKY